MSIKILKKIVYDSLQHLSIDSKMTIKSLDSVNLHSFYPYLMPKNEHFPILKTHIFLSEFEQYCLSGDIQALNDYLNQAHGIKHEQQLMRGLLISIEQNQLAVFQFLIQTPIYSSIVQRHLLPIRNFILKVGKIDFLSTLENNFSKHHPQTLHSLCSPSLNIAISQLLSYYQSSLACFNLDQHYQTMLETLAKLYQKNKAFDSFDVFELPLTYESFIHIKSQLDEKKLKTFYQQNRLHKAWRLLHPKENWFADAHEMKVAGILKKNQWLVVLMWLSANDENLLPHLFPLSIEERLTLFFERLSYVFGDEQQIKKQIFQSVIGHPYNQLLTEEIVIFEHERFLHQHILKQFKDTELEELNYLINVIKKNQLISHPLYLEKIVLTSDDYEIFYQRMSSKWSSQWESNSNLLQISKEVLSDAHLILQTHQHTLIEAIKYLCQQNYLKPVYGFFKANQIKAITSISPTTADERVPLSYGVPESPKS